MSTWFEVRQKVCTVKGCRLECVYDSSIYRVAVDAYRKLSLEVPAEYFELIRVEHNEDCLGHTGAGRREST